MSCSAQMGGLAVLPDKMCYLAEILIANTWACNLNCTYCFVRNRELTANHSRMSPEMAVQVVDALDQGLTHVEKICIHFYGGEPLTNIPAIEAMVNRAAEKSAGRFGFAITTNGAILDCQAVYEIMDKGNFQIILSIDGPREIHDQCRRTVSGEPTHEKVLKFLSGIREHTRCWVRGSAVVRSGWSLKEAVSYLESLPIDAIKAQAVRAGDQTPYVLTGNEKARYLRELEEIGEFVIKELEVGRAPKDDRFSSRVLQLLAGKRRESFCGAGYTSFGITPDGTILPCILIERSGNELGHIFDEGAAWLQKGIEWRERRRNRVECGNCDSLTLCGGGCDAVMSVCGEDECEIVRKNCEVATAIYRHFKSSPTKLLALAGVV
jgi:uncharacterized protein